MTKTHLLELDSASLTIVNRYLLYVCSPDGKLSVAVHADGRVEYGQAYDADRAWRETARASCELVNQLEQLRAERP